MAVRTKRAYETPAADDGLRVLIDRYWPRGLRKDRAKIDLHATDLAPSSALRRWFDHDPDRFGEFRRRYREELDHGDGSTLDDLLERARAGTVTLVYAARDTEHNDAVVLAALLEERLQDADGPGEKESGP